jgi:hypothetical protein
MHSIYGHALHENMTIIKDKLKIFLKYYNIIVRDQTFKSYIYDSVKFNVLNKNQL